MFLLKMQDALIIKGNPQTQNIRKNERNECVSLLGPGSPIKKACAD